MPIYMCTGAFVQMHTHNTIHKPCILVYEDKNAKLTAYRTASHHSAGTAKEGLDHRRSQSPATCQQVLDIWRSRGHEIP